VSAVASRRNGHHTLAPGAVPIRLSPGAVPIRLSPGAHSSPAEGVCVVELASVLANEKFSDRPRCVCPVIGAFLRGWNDRATHAERQRLTPYAARIVGSRGGHQVTRARRDLCLEWAGADLAQGPARCALARAGMRLRIGVYCSVDAALRLNEGAGDYASRVAAVRGDADAALELLDALLAVGTPAVRSPAAAPRALSANGNAAANGNGQLPDDWAQGDTLPRTDVGMSEPSADQSRADERLGAGR
jgi:hypothetical protein